MKVLLTGGSGFLGKQVLELLLADDRITRVDVLSRSKKSHPDPKVRIIALDLSKAESLALIPPDCTVVVHLAGLYDFKKDQVANYANNVLSASNLVEYLRSTPQTRGIPVIAASSYVVGLGCPDDEAENTTSQLPPAEISYAYTKALSEKLFTDSGLPCTVFRLGILIGNSVDGSIEKIEGPYYLMSALAKLSGLQLPFKRIPLPMPGNPDQIFPIVPVDYAAKAFHEALFKKETFTPGTRIYGVYREEGVTLRKLCTTLVKRIAPSFRPVFPGSLPTSVVRHQELLTGIPRDALRMASESVALGSRRFETSFPEVNIPAFDQYKDSFIQGFLDASLNSTPKGAHHE